MLKCCATVLTLLMPVAAGYAQSPAVQGQIATANFADAENQPVGTARLTSAPHGLILSLEFTNVPPGTHAVHVHTVGRCDAPSFESAGAHFEPGAKKHGLLNTAGPHAGDLPNVTVPENRKLTAEFLVRDVTLGGGAAGLMDADGAALVLHSGRDDHATDPAGGSGSRIACAVIVPPTR
jgi:Cu-Zn family superoxide dismutase